MSVKAMHHRAGLSKEKPIFNGDPIVSYSAFFSLGQTLTKTTKSLLAFYLPNGGIIYDPTCGEKNYQFGWLKDRETAALDNWMTRRGRAVLTGPAKMHYEYVASDLKPAGHVIAELHNLPLRSKFSNVTWYDPPFAPMCDPDDPRAAEYGIEMPRTMKDVKQFYSAKILQELERVTRDFIFVRGQDMYSPPNTTNYYPFHQTALSALKKVKGIALLAIYQYRFNHARLPMWRACLKHVQRPIITHGNIAVLKVEPRK